MSSLFGASKQKTESTTNPYKGLPEWATEYYEQDAQLGQNLIGSTAEQAEWRANNPEQSVVGMSPDEIYAIEALMAENDQNQQLLDGSLDAIGGDRFMSGYTDDVVDSTLANFDRQQMRDQAGREASVAGVGGYSNTRAGVADALSGQLGNMSRAQLEAQLRDDAFRFGTDAGFQESAAMRDTAQLGQDLQGMASQWQATGGETQRGIKQQRVNAPMDAVNWYTDVFNSSRSLPPTGGGKTTGTEPGPSMASQLLGAASSAAGIWTALSDERAKEDIAAEDGALDKLRDVGSFSYTYKQGLGHTEDRTTGLMAQDLERAGITGAVLEGRDGLKRVDPYPVLATVVQAVRELDERTRSAGI